MHLMMDCVAQCQRRRSEEPRRVDDLPPEYRAALETMRGLTKRRLGATAAPALTLKRGKTFEYFTAAAFRLRWLTRSPDAQFVANMTVKTKGTTVGVYILSERSEIERLLGAVPYRLFPCGFDLLSTPPPSMPPLPQVDLSDATAVSPSSASPGVDASRPTAVAPMSASPSASILPSFVLKSDGGDCLFYGDDLSHDFVEFPGCFTAEPAGLGEAFAMCRMGSRRRRGSAALTFTPSVQSLATSCACLANWVLKKVPFVAVPKLPNNPHCDVVACLFQTKRIDILLIECRDRKYVTKTDYLHKIRNLRVKSSAIPHVDKWLTEALPGYCVQWHFVLAGKCDVALTTSEIHDVELAAVC